MTGPYVARDSWNRRDGWCVWKRATRGGDRRMATGMSERTARLVARLLNDAAGSSGQPG